jgi:hypothetical protein
VNTVFFLTFLLAGAPAGVLANDIEGDLLKLQADLQNLEADLSSLPPDALTSSQREQVERIREEAIYLKVKAQKSDGNLSEIRADEIRDLRLAISDLRNDIRPQIAAAAPKETSLTLSSGTEIDLRLEDSLSSETASVGDRFEAIAAEPILSGDRVALEAGTPFRGRVELVDQAGRGTDRTARLVLVIEEMEHHGKTYEVDGTVVGASEDLKTGIGSEVKKIGIGAGLGTVLGAVLGGKKGAVIGATVGGAGVILGTEGEEVELPRGTILKFRLDRELTLPSST